MRLDILKHFGPHKTSHDASQARSSTPPTRLRVKPKTQSSAIVRQYTGYAGGPTPEAVSTIRKQTMKNKSFLELLVGAFGSLGFWVAVWILAFILYSTGVSQ